MLETQDQYARLDTAARTQPVVLEPLTPRELEVLVLVAEGMDNETIADMLGLQRATVGSHLRNIYQKFSCRGRTQAAVMAIRQGIID